MLSSLFTRTSFLLDRPRNEGTVYDAFLDDYRQAEKLGQSENATCSRTYRDCQISLFEMFQGYSTPEDKPDNWPNTNDDYNDATAEENNQEPVDGEQLLAEKQFVLTRDHVNADNGNHVS